MADLAAAIKQAEEALAVWHDRHSPLDPLSLAFALRSLLSAAREAEARAEKAEAALAGGGR